MATDALDPDAVLQYVHTQRLKLLEKFAPNGSMPGDTREAQVVQSVLTDMSRDAMGNKRLKVEKNVGDKMVEAQALIAAVLASPQVKHIGVGVRTAGAPTLPDNIVEVQVKSNEFNSTGMGLENYSQFVSRMSDMED